MNMLECNMCGIIPESLVIKKKVVFTIGNLNTKGCIRLCPFCKSPFKTLNENLINYTNIIKNN